MNHTEELQHIFEASLRRVADKLQGGNVSEPLTDLFICPNPETGEFSVLDDNHAVLDSVAVESWHDSEELNEEAELEISETILKALVAQMAEEGVFDKISLQKPFSVVMADGEMETLAELYLVDDDTVSLDENLLKQVDQELNDFFKQLMSNF